MRRLYSDFWDEKNFFFEKKFFLTFSEIFLTIFQQNFFQRLLFSFGQWSKIVMNQFPFFWCYSRVSMCHNWAVIGRNQKYFRRPWAKITKFWVSRTGFESILYGTLRWKLFVRAPVSFPWEQMKKAVKISFLAGLNQKFHTGAFDAGDQRPARWISIWCPETGRKNLCFRSWKFLDYIIRKVFLYVFLVKKRKKSNFWSDRPWVFCPSRPNGKL